MLNNGLQGFILIMIGSDLKMSRSTPNSFQDDINRLVHVFLNRIEQLKMRLIYGVQILRGTNGKELRFDDDGNIYYDGDRQNLFTIETQNYGHAGTAGYSTNSQFPYLHSLSDVQEIFADAGLIRLNTGVNTIYDASFELQYDAAGSYAKLYQAYLDMNSNKITNLATPTASTDAATKAYVDSVGGGGVTDHGALSGLADDDHPQYMKNLDEDSTPELAGDINFANYDAYYCNLLYFYDNTGNNVLGTGASGQIMAVSGLNGSVLGYGSGGTVNTQFGVNSSHVYSNAELDMNENKIYLYDSGTDSTSVYFWADTVNNKVIWHVPTGWTFDTTVG